MRTVVSIAVLLCLGSLLIAEPLMFAIAPVIAQDVAQKDSTAPLEKEPAAPSDSEKVDQPKSTSFWMEKKMEYSQTLLRGLAVGDFRAIETSGRQLRTLSRVEGFVRKRDPNYRAHLNTFELVCDEIVRQAEKENLEGATLAFNQLTVSCVTCHRASRGRRPESHAAI